MSNIMNIEKKALSLYKPPFKFQCGYIYDSNGDCFADINARLDDTIEAADGSIALRVRGWGRIQYIKSEFDCEDLQDAVGHEIVKALNKHWEAYGKS